MTGFDQAAATYDRSRHALIPDHDVLYAAAVDALNLAGDRPVRVLDLGAGTGGFSTEVINRHPHARMHLVDVSEKMLNQARGKFDGDERFSFAVLDALSAPLGEGWDRVISSFVIHHFPHEDKRAVFAKVAKSLKPGGIFVNVDQVQACSQAVQDIHLRLWKKDVLAAGALPQDLEDGLRRMAEMDINAELDDQVLWLQQAGFISVEVVYRNYFYAVFVARKAG